MKKLIIALSIMGVLSIGVVSLLSQKKSSSILDTAPNLEINSASLINAFESNEVTANQKFANKVIQVKGPLDTFTIIDEDHYQISLGSSHTMGKVVCNLDLKQNVDLKDLEIGDLLEVKGICTGYLFDVVLDQALIIQ